MGQIILFMAFGCAALSLVYPWVGVLYGYMTAILTPQDIWFWAFRGVRADYWVLLPTCIGTLFGLLISKFDLSILRGRRNAYLVVLWLCVALSYFAGPYTSAGGPYRFDDPLATLEQVDKMMLLYFVACLSINSQRNAKALLVVVVASLAYLTFWANDQYLTGHYFGRLQGPMGAGGGGLYVDQNAFAMLFVVAQSFFWFFGLSFKNAVWRWSCWLLIPLSWNAIFLTGSRGGFLGLAATLLLISVRSRRKFLGLLLIPVFAVAVIFHGGSVMKDRLLTIGHYQQNASAEDRVEAWHAALGMIKDHPLTGVGLASFGPAFSHYSDKHPREAHDTFLQITAESGVVAGAMYLLISMSLIWNLWRNGTRLKRLAQGVWVDDLLVINEATLIGFCGLLVCSIFLSLQNYEIYYCLNVLANSVLYLSRIRQRNESPAITADAVAA